MYKSRQSMFLLLVCQLLALSHVFAQEVASQSSGQNNHAVAAQPTSQKQISVRPTQGKQPPSPGDIVVIDTVPTLLAPKTFRMTQRRSDRIGLQWHDRTELEESVQVLRSGTKAIGEAIATFGPQTGFNSYVDTNVEPDTLYCYRIRVTRGEQWRVSDALCIYTQAATDLFLFAAQVQIKVANRNNAGTDDPIAVRLNAARGAGFRPSGNETWLNYGHNDFEQGSTFTYDLLIPARLSDITMLTLVKEGTDAVCIESIKLVLNPTDDRLGVAVLDKNFLDEADGCHWVDEGDGHEPILHFPYAELRSSRVWPTTENQWCGDRAACAASIFTMKLSTLEHRLEGSIGHFLHFDKRSDWPRQPTTEGLPLPRRVALSVIDYRTARIRIQLKGDAPILPDPNIVISGDIVIVPIETSAGAALSLELNRVRANVDFNLLADALGVAGGVLIGSESCINLMDCLEAYIEGSIEGSFSPISERFELAEIGDSGLCPLLELSGDNNNGREPVIKIASPLATCTDFDNDRMPNTWEDENGYDRYDPSDKIDDPDGSGVNNSEQFDCVACNLGEGDCDTDEQCGEGRICATDNGPLFGYPENWDICVCAPNSLCNSPTTSKMSKAKVN